MLSLTLLGCVKSSEPDAAFTVANAGRLMPIVASAPTPEPAKAFIKRNPDFIRVLRQSKSDKPLDGGPRTIALLEQVNREGNTLITWTDDRRAWGVVDSWDFPCEYDSKLYDDCDSFALWKMRRLIELGLPSTPLLLTLGQTEDGTGHAVLVVHTTTGDYVLDNRFSEVKTMSEIVALNYNLMWRVATGDRMDRWVVLQRTRPDLPAPTKISSINFGTPLCFHKNVG